MQRDQFSQMLQAPHSVLPEQRNDLIQLTQNYPWFTVAHVLLAKLDHDHRHIQYHTHLKKAAVYAPDREVLYNVFMKPQLQATVESFDAACEVEEAPLVESQHTQPEVSTSIDPVQEPVEEKAEVTEVLVVEVDLPQNHVPEEVHVEQPAEEEIEFTEALEVAVEHVSETDSDDRSVAVTPSPTIKRANDFDDLQREILLEAITSSIEQEVGEQEVEAVQPLLPQPKDPVVEPPSEKLSAYTRWLLQKSSVESTSPAPQQIEEQRPSAPVDLKEKQRNLIDTFIQNDPKISKGRVEMFSTENLARMSLVEDERFVTETMAAIFARQGHIKKAIKAYQLLALNYPEKSVYFANQIKKLQERR